MAQLWPAHYPEAPTDELHMAERFDDDFFGRRISSKIKILSHIRSPQNSVFCPTHTHTDALLD